MKNRLCIKKLFFMLLVTLVFFSSYFLARYVSTFHGGNNADVAKWSVEYSHDKDEINLISGNTVEEFPIYITSTSEVSSNYSIVLSNVPTGMEVKIDDSEYISSGLDNRVVFDNVGSFGAGDVGLTRMHVISFDAPLDSNIPSSNNVGIDVRFVQVD